MITKDEFIFDYAPDPEGLYESFANTGRKTYENLNDLIDNSLDAMYSELEGGKRVIKVQEINIKWGKAPGQLPFPEFSKKLGWIVTDLGTGVEDVNNLWKAGRSNKSRFFKIFRGQYGMGLKTSTLSLGESVLVVTSLKGEDMMKALPFNVEQAKKNTSFKGTGKKYNDKKSKHYTNIFITDCYDEDPDVKRIRKELSRTWYNVISDDIKIKFNGRLLMWKPPNVYSQNDTENLREKYGMENIPSLNQVWADFDFDFREGKDEFNVTGYLGIQQKPNQEFDGFDMYWGGRLIQPNSDCGIGASTYGLYGQIELPINFPVNFQKTKISPRGVSVRKLHEEINKRVKHVVKFSETMRDIKPKKISQSTKKYTRIAEQMLEKALSRKLNRLLKDFNITDEIKKKVDKKYANDFGIIDIDTHPELSDVDKKELKKEILKNPPKPRRSSPKEGFYISETGERIKLRHEVRSMGENKFFSAQQPYQKKELVIITNSDHPMYKTYESNTRGKQIAFLHIEHMIAELGIFLEARTGKSSLYWKDQVQRLFSSEDMGQLK